MSGARSIDSIIIGERHRKAMGDVAGLADNIRDIGLLHPISISADRALLAGQRRLEACKLLGWTEIPVTVVEEKRP
jgi:ParB family transcriptional regulator, chromosome partitioning protein